MTMVTEMFQKLKFLLYDLSSCYMKFIFVIYVIFMLYVLLYIYYNLYVYYMFLNLFYISIFTLFDFKFM